MVAHCVEEVTKKFDFVERYQIQPELKMKNCGKGITLINLRVPQLCKGYFWLLGGKHPVFFWP